MVVIDFVNSPSLEIVQALYVAEQPKCFVLTTFDRVLHTHCHQSLSSTNPDGKIATIVSAGIRVGMMMGLNRLPSETQEATRRPGFLKREVCGLTICQAFANTLPSWVDERGGISLRGIGISLRKTDERIRFILHKTLQTSQVTPAGRRLARVIV